MNNPPDDTYVHRDAGEALSCRCNIKCCHFKGCCAKNPGRNLESPPYVEDYEPTTIQNTAPKKDHPGIGFFDFPAEIRNKIYIQVVLSDEVIRMKLNPTIMDHGEENKWGRDNAWALLGVCRRLYHETSSMAYMENYFQVWRGTHRDFTITKHPGMPYDRIQFLHLFYPMETSPCSWQMDHMWSHWLDDVEMVRKHFPNLRRLFLKMGYDGFDPNTLHNYYSWAPLMFRGPSESADAMLKRVTAVLRAMTQLHGRKMPQCVQINFWGYFHNPATDEFFPPDHEPHVINHAILKVSDPNIDMLEYKRQSYPLHWITGPKAVMYGNERDPMDYEMHYGPEPSEYDSE